MDIDPAWYETDFYAVLGVDAGAPAAEVTTAYRRLARALHPDTNPDPDAVERFRQVTQAYDVLRDDGRRAAYDRVRGTAAPRSRRGPRRGYRIRVTRVDRPR